MWSIWERPQIVFINFIGVEILKPQQTIYVTIQLNET
jgi:hypothetical protein